MPVVFIENQKIIFVHIPKTGGTSIEKYLEAKNDFKVLGKNQICWEHLDPIPESFNKYVSPQHQTFQSLQKFAPDFQMAFATVRNPYDRLVSDLFFLKLIKEDTTKEEVELAIINYFKKGKTKYDCHYKEQYKFLINEQGVLDPSIKIIKTENLNEDMQKIGFHDFQIVENLNRCNVDKKNYHSYLSNWSVHLINIFYKQDFELFGYTMINNENTIK